MWLGREWDLCVMKSWDNSLWEPKERTLGRVSLEGNSLLWCDPRNTGSKMEKWEREEKVADRDLMEQVTVAGSWAAVPHDSVEMSPGEEQVSFSFYQWLLEGCSRVIHSGFSAWSTFCPIALIWWASGVCLGDHTGLIMLGAWVRYERGGLCYTGWPPPAHKSCACGLRAMSVKVVDNICLLAFHRYTASLWEHFSHLPCLIKTKELWENCCFLNFSQNRNWHGKRCCAFG